MNGADPRMSEGTQVVRLSILDTYAVRWSRETFARDLLQNFFDAAPDFRDVKIGVERARGRVELRGPVAFDLDYLAYLGATTKRDGSTVGGFGEGFKICALVGTRDFGLTMTAGSGPVELTVFYDEVPLGRELCYRLRERPTPFPGSFVRLEGCDEACLDAFAASSNMFRHADNPKLRAVLVEDPAQGVAVVASPFRDRGELYYRRQLRGTVRYWSRGADRSITLIHDGVIAKLEGDRDRGDLPARAMAEAVGDALASEALHQVFLHLVPYWERGNEVLHGLISAACRRQLCFEWPKGWLARSSGDHGMTDLAERQGFSIAMASFAVLGMPTAKDHYRTDLETRQPTELERARFQVVANLYATLHGRPPNSKTFEVFDDMDRAAVLGQYFRDKIIVAAPLLQGELDDVASTILHELAHEAGGEESRSFLGRLKGLLGAALRRPEAVVEARARYRQITEEDAPAEEPAEEKPPEAFCPHEDLQGLKNHKGVPCILIVPPAFPPSAEILDALRSAGESLSIELYVMSFTLTGEDQPHAKLAPGIPTLFIGGRDAETLLPLGEIKDGGYRLRTYGRDSLCPAPDRLSAAMLKAREEGFTGMRGYGKQIDRLHQALESRLPKDSKPPEKGPMKQRNDKVIDRLSRFSGGPGWGLGGLWNTGIHAAGETLLQGYGEDPKAPDEVWEEIKARILEAIELARRLRREDPAFDDADSFERDMMRAAQGAAVLGHVQEAGEAAERRAREDFEAVRRASDVVLDLEVGLDLKRVVLESAIGEAGLSDILHLQTEGLDRDRLAKVFERFAAEALHYQNQCDEEDTAPYHRELTERLKGEEKRREEREQKLAIREQQRRRAEATWSLYRTWEETLRETHSPVAAARRLLEEAPQRFKPLKDS